MEVHHKWIQDDILSLNHDMIFIHFQHNLILQLQRVVHLDLYLDQVQSVLDLVPRCHADLLSVFIQNSLIWLFPD